MTSSQVQQDAQLVGTLVAIRWPKIPGVLVNCVVRDVRRSYNHLELQVEPKDGEGKWWVRSWADHAKTEEGWTE